MGPWFKPLASGYVDAHAIGVQLRASPLDQIQAVLDDFCEMAFLAPTEKSGSGGQPLYRATSAAWHAREEVLIKRGARHSCLVRQREYDIDDLVLAVAMVPLIVNRRPRGMFFGMQPEVSLTELDIYLRSYGREEIRAAVDRLITKGSLRKAEPFEDPPSATVAATPLGERAYFTSVAAKLGLREDDTVLDEDRLDSIRIFYAWQSDHPSSRNHIGDALDRIIASANREWPIVAPLKLERAVELGDGSVRIDVTLMEKIAAANYVVADITPVHAIPERLLPNSNVLIEVGFSLASGKPRSLFLVEHGAKTDELLERHPRARLPFDIDHVSRITYRIPKSLRERLRADLEKRLRADGLLRPTA